jgi:hypothetical protein
MRCDVIRCDVSKAIVLKYVVCLEMCHLCTPYFIDKTVSVLKYVIVSSPNGLSRYMCHSQEDRDCLEILQLYHCQHLDSGSPLVEQP